jgi:signal transduction histidine kinase
LTSPVTRGPTPTTGIAPRRLPLKLILPLSGLALYAVVALILWAVVGAQVRISGLAADTRDKVLPDIVSRQEIARDVERLILFGEEMLNSAEPGRRRRARLSAQMLVYNEAGFRADTKIQEVGKRTLETLARLSAERDRRDQLNDQSFRLLMTLGSRPPAGSQESWRALLITLMNSDSTAALDELGPQLASARRTLPGGQLDQLQTLRRQIIDIDRGNTAAWEQTTRELKTVTDILAVQAQELTKARFSEILQHASQAERVGIAGLGLVMLVLLVYGLTAHRYFLRPLVAATGRLEQAMQGGQEFGATASAFSEIGSIVTAATTLVDNTRTIEAERRKALSARLEAAEAASRMKSEFLAVMGHELRTPMNGVLGMAQLLQMGDLNAEQQEQVDVILASARELQTVLADILEFVAAADGRVAVRRRPCDLRQVLRDAIDTWTPAAAGKSVALRLTVAEDVPAVLSLDEDHLGRLLAVLLKNAVSFTDRGEVQVTAALAKNGPLCLAVRDTGIGMSPAVVANLFQPFHQADTSATRRHGGIGLGLALAKRLTEAMGGDITVASAPGQGSTFEIRLPVG